MYTSKVRVKSGSALPDIFRCDLRDHNALEPSLLTAFLMAYCVCNFNLFKSDRNSI